MELIDKSVLRRTQDDFESPETISSNVANDLDKHVTTRAIFDSYLRLLDSGLVNAYRFDSRDNRYVLLDKTDVSDAANTWFLAIRDR